MSRRCIYGMRDKPYQANQTRERAGARCSKLAEAWGMTRAAGATRARSVRQIQGASPGAVSLRLRNTGASARVLHEAAGDGSVFASAVPAIRLLLLTGCRKNEIVTLQLGRHRPHGGGAAASRFGKTGARRVPLTPVVEWVLAGASRASRATPGSSPARIPGDHLKNLDAIWLRLRRRAGSRRRAHPRRQAFVCVASAGPRRGAMPTDRRAARSPQGDDDGALCASGARHREGGGGEGRRQHRRRTSSAATGRDAARTVVMRKGIRSEWRRLQDEDDLAAHGRGADGREGHGVLGPGTPRASACGSIRPGAKSMSCRPAPKRQGGARG